MEVPVRAPRRVRLHRMLAGLVAATVASAALVAIAPTPASAAENTLMFWPDQSVHKTFGPNGVIRIDGTLDYDAVCDDDGSRPGIDDFLYPATDVYIVALGSAGGVGAGLTDAAGGGPNTIVGQASHIFIDEVIGITSPGGTLSAGVYDVVYDTCQDGAVGPEDEIFSEAITVEMPEGDLPPVDASITRLKDAAREQYASWVETHTALTALFKADKAVEFLKCFIAPDPACLSGFLYAIYDVDNLASVLNNPIEDAILNLVNNVAQNHGAIWKDPPDADFDQPTTLDPIAAPSIPTTGHALPDALSGVVAPLADEAAMTEGLLHAIERYQGAQAAGDTAWALAQAREVRDLSATLSDRLASSDAVEQFRDEFAAHEDAIEVQYNEGRLTLRRFRHSGFSATERQQLANQGLDANAIAALEATYVPIGTIPTYFDGSLLDIFENLVSVRTELGAALDETVAGWDDTVAALELRVDEEDALPVANANGPYTVAAGAAVQLDAAGSTAPATYAWDLDADGAFDDATGATPAAAFEASTIVGLRVTDNGGKQAVDYASVAVTDADNAPVIDDSSPAAHATVVVGTPQAFSVDVNDPDGDALTYAWELDGEPAGNGAGFSYNPPADAIGRHVLRVVVGGAGPASVTHAWRITVHAPDVDDDGWTATSDCNDARTDIHPGRFEAFGNGIDDDCDTGTPDAPPGGLVGAAWSWGTQSGLGTSSFNNSHTPAPIPALPAVVQIESTFGGGVAVLADGQVRTWGQQIGIIGDGASVTRKLPVSPLAVGGAPASTLSGVVEVDSEHAGVIARARADGSVIAWGDNVNGQVGDRSTVQLRTSPVPVVTENGTPINDAIDVAQGETTNYIVRADGTVWTVGVDRCHGTNTFTAYHYAIPAPMFGNDVVQIEAGDSYVLARKADGTVVSCGSSQAELGRGSAPMTAQQQHTPLPVIGFGPGSGAVDISVGASSGQALKEDGTVWMWGRNLNGEMNAAGVPHGQSRFVPFEVDVPGAPVVDINNDAATHTIAVHADGTAVIWGGNYDGAAGTGSFSPNPAVGFHVQNIAGDVVAGAVSQWGSVALVRPLAAPDWDRPAQYITATVADTEIGESTGGAFTVTLSQPAPDDLTVTWAIDGGNTGTATIAKGAASVAIPVSVTDDAIDEDNTDVAFQMHISHGIDVEDGTAVGTVIDDDDPPAFSVSSTTVEEGDTSLTDVALTVSLSAPSGKATSVQYATADGSATAPGDYTSSVGTVEIAPGETEADIHVAVIGDTDMETEESFAVTLTDPVNATLGDAQGAIIVTDDEPLSLTVTSPTVTEGDTGTTAAMFTVKTTAPPAGTTVTVPWSIAGGTAELDGDIEAASGVLTFDAGTTMQLVTVNVVADEVVEPLAIETFRFVIGEPSASDGRAVLRSDAQPASIVDDDVTETGPVVDAGSDVSGVEGTAIAIVGTVDDDAPATSAWVATDARCTIDDPAALATTVTCSDNLVADLVLTADDGTATATDTASVTVGNAGPTVTITAPVSGTEVEAGETIVVAADVTDPGAGDTVTCSVDFGDGTPAVTDCDTTHTYTANGPFTITVVATDDDGASATATTTITVAESAPVVDAGPDANGLEGSAVAIAGTVVDDDAVTTQWTVDDARCKVANAAAVSTTVTCTDNVVVHATLSANDGTSTGSDTTTVTITNAVPSLRIDAPADGADVVAGTTVAVRTAVSDPGASDVVTCVVDWGDGSAPSTGCAPSHRFGEQGVFTITVTAKDDDGAQTQVLTTLVVTATSSTNALVVGGGRLAGGDVTVGGLVVPLVGKLRLGLVGGTFTDASGRHNFGALGADGFTAANGKATWSATGAFDNQRNVKLTITVTDGGKGKTDHVKLTVKSSSGQTLVNADADVRYGGFIVR